MTSPDDIHDTPEYQTITSFAQGTFNNLYFVDVTPILSKSHYLLNLDSKLSHLTLRSEGASVLRRYADTSHTSYDHGAASRRKARYGRQRNDAETIRTSNDKDDLEEALATEAPKTTHRVDLSSHYLLVTDTDNKIPGVVDWEPLVPQGYAPELDSLYQRRLPTKAVSYCPAWVREFHAEKQQADFEAAVGYCHSEFSSESVKGVES
ncbi:hypothetical protein BT96DRAFT_1023987 [Gymnopus androsaceus JB14]|uniref:Uncharacterized protein n=1 Tax=Gymnopus androsaceus JB14 TaxID=1447944 RepID=A0A6A4H1G9_9AGAR|nr:hypothetical protein BT96DRAFT_1023987 [Gymnopus androsaceus JB14]